MEKAKALIEKYKAGTCNEAEKQLIDKWLFEIHSGETSDLTTEDFEQIQAGVWEYIEENKQKRKISKLWPRFTLPRIAAAAAVLLVVGLSIFFYKSYYAPRHSGAGQNLGLASNDIKPGSNKAYLILSNGKRLSLTDATNGAIAKEAGVEITKTADGEVVYASGTSYSNALNTIETPRGGQYQIVLPDGSKVWLNAASKLIYPVTFNGRGQREVTLSGEAYFEIAKDKQHPFKVKSTGQEVTVLGTHFNINSYTDEASVKTTLLEGSVKVNDAILKPGEQAMLTGTAIKVQQVALDEAIAWKNGLFYFNNTPIQNVMRQVERWYDVEVTYQTDDLKKSILSGSISRYSNVSALLNAIQQTGAVKFKIEGRKIIVQQ